MRSWRNLDLLDRAVSRGVLLLLLLLPPSCLPVGEDGSEECGVNRQHSESQPVTSCVCVCGIQTDTQGVEPNNRCVNNPVSSWWKLHSIRTNWEALSENGLTLTGAFRRPAVC